MQIFAQETVQPLSRVIFVNRQVDHAVPSPDRLSSPDLLLLSRLPEMDHVMFMCDFILTDDKKSFMIVRNMMWHIRFC